MVALLGVMMLFVGAAMLVRSGFGAASASTLAAATTVTAAQLQQEIARGNPGAFRPLVEVTGALRSDAPVTAPRSGRACAAYVTKVTRRVEEAHRDRAPGSVAGPRHRGDEVVSEEREEAVCYVDDGTGRVEVALTGADMDMTEVEDTFTPEEAPLTTPLAREAVAVMAGEVVERRQLGLQHRESILPLGGVVHVVGEVRVEDGKPRISAGRGEPIRVSLESREKRVEEARGSVATGRFLGAFLLLHGVVLLVLGLR